MAFLEKSKKIKKSKALSKYKLVEKKYFVFSAHREENIEVNLNFRKRLSKTMESIPPLTASKYLLFNNSIPLSSKDDKKTFSIFFIFNCKNKNLNFAK